MTKYHSNYKKSTKSYIGIAPNLDAIESVEGLTVALGGRVAIRCCRLYIAGLIHMMFGTMVIPTLSVAYWKIITMATTSDSPPCFSLLTVTEASFARVSWLGLIVLCF